MRCTWAIQPASVGRQGSTTSWTAARVKPAAANSVVMAVVVGKVAAERSAPGKYENMPDGAMSPK